MNNILKFIIGGLATCALITTATATPSVVNVDMDAITLYDEVNDESINNVISALSSTKSAAPVLLINSQGGSIFAGMRLVSFLKTYDKPVHCVAFYAASMADAILQSCTVRLGHTNNLLLQHRAFGGVNGNPDQILQIGNLLKNLEDELNKLEAERIKMPLAVFKEKVKYEWTTMGKESLDTNRIDKIVDVKCKPETISNYKVKQVSVGWFTIPVKFYQCPLMAPVIDRESLDKQRSMASPEERVRINSAVAEINEKGLISILRNRGK